MTQDEIMEMAREASVFGYVYDAGDTPHLWQFDNKQLIAFVNLVAAKEREACAKVCDEFNFGQTPMMIQRAIRARGEQVAINDTSQERVDEIQKQRHEANVQKFLGAPQPELSAPCAKHCEATAFQITIKNLEAQLAQRTWVGLTDEEFNELDKEDLSLRQFVQAIDDRLKEKNT